MESIKNDMRHQISRWPIHARTVLTSYPHRRSAARAVPIGRSFIVKIALPPTLAALICLSASSMALAQNLPQAPSPATGMSLSKPQFDTETPHYNVAGVADKAASTVVADVGGRTITLGNVGDGVRDLPPGPRAQPFDTVYPGVLKRLIQIQALVLRAQKRGLDKDPQVVRRAQLAYDSVLADAVLVREAGAGIAEQKLLERYDRDLGDKPGPEEVDVFIILLPTEAEAVAVIAELAGGADFATVAHRVSKDSSAAVGGDLGFRPLGVLTPEIGAVAFAMLPGQTAPRPVRTGAGWFVVRVGEHRQGQNPSFAAVREEIRTNLIREAFPAIVEAALADTVIHTYDITGPEGQHPPGQ